MPETVQVPPVPQDIQKVVPEPVLARRLDRVKKESALEGRLQSMRLDNQGTFEEWGKAFKLDGGGTLFRALGREVQKLRNPEWEEYSLTAEDYSNILAEFGIEGSQHNLEFLKRSTSKEELRLRAEELKLQADLTRDLANAGVKRFVAGVLNVPENAALVAAGAVTGGAAAVAMLGARATRVAHTAGTTAAMLGSMYVDEIYGGKEYTAADYVAAGAMVGALSYGFGPKVIDKRTGGKYSEALRLSGEAARRPELTKQPELSPRSDKVVQKFTPAESAAKSGSAIRMLSLDTQTRVADWYANAKQTAQAARTPEQLRTLSSEFNKLRQEIQQLEPADVRPVSHYTPPAGAVHPVTGEKLTRAERRELGKQLRKEAKAEPRAERQALEQRQQEIRQEVRDAKDGQVAAEELRRYTEDGTLPHAVRKAMRDSEIQAYHQALAQLGDISTAASGSSNLSAEASSAVEGVVRQQRGFLKAPVDLSKRAFAGFQRLVSEHEKITLGNPTLRKMLSKLVDDPLARETLVQNNAAATLRANQLKAATEMKQWEDALVKETRGITGTNAATDLAGYSDKFLEARLKLEHEVAELLLERNHAEINGWSVPPAPNTAAGRLVELYEDVTRRSLTRAQDQGLEGVQGLAPRAGYFHRSWNYEKMLRVANEAGEATVIRMLSLAMQSQYGARMPAADANVVAKAIWNRTRNSATDARTDFMGQLGSQETDSIIQMLKESGADVAAVESIQRRLQQNLKDAGQVKYAKDRIPMDMQLVYRDAAGKEWRMSDLIDTDLTRLLENYQHGMAGRGALARAGIGGDGSSISTFKNQYMQELAKLGVPPTQRDGISKQLDHIFGDFTGIRPDSAITGEWGSIGKSLASASMLGSTGLLQVAETGIIAAHHGYVAVAADFLKRVPVVGRLMKDIGHNPELYKEWQSVLGLSFSADQRMQIWKRQIEIGQETASKAVRYAKAMESLTPSITGQRWVLNRQSHMALNLNLVKIAKATRGGAEELKTLQRLAPELDDDTLRRIGKAVQWEGNSVKQFRVGSLSDSDLEALQNAVIRMHDNQLLAMRPGYGTSYQRSAVGQLIGQFTSYVGMAHNVVSRATFHHEGSLGVAKILAYQFPLMLMVTYINEVRKGNVLDLSKEEDLTQLATQALTYSAVMGLYGDAVQTIFGTGPARNVAAFRALEAPGMLFGAAADAFAGNPDKALAGAIEGVSAVSVLGAVPGTQALVKALKED